MERKQISKSLFPKKFLWGASTASHQVEGGTFNQWTVWELSQASELSKSAENIYKDFPSWPDIKSKAEDPNNYVSGMGVDHYRRYKEDFDLLKELNLNSFRFSIEWSRIEPKEGEWDEAEVEHYRTYIQELKNRDITPILNIWHWTMPTWFTDKGGFKNRKNIQYFTRFVDKVAKEFCGDLEYVITINEPNVYGSLSYLTGEWPPQERSFVSFFKVYLHLVIAHKKSYKILKTVNPKLNIGIAAQLANIQAKRPHNVIDGISTKLMRYFWNWWFLRRIRKYQDFLGINYYFTDYYAGLFKRRNPKVPLNDMGWYMEPEGLYPILLRAFTRYKKPIIITENGLADHEDQFRRWWIEETIVAMERALSEGVDIIGYLHWSLLDNFEWDKGWWPKFGLIEVDRSNMSRTIRPSAKWFAEKITKL